MSEPKNIADAERQLQKARNEYLQARDAKDTAKMKRISTQIYALHEWVVAHERRK
jgi:hypothetical protein